MEKQKIPENYRAKVMSTWREEVAAEVRVTCCKSRFRLATDAGKTRRAVRERFRLVDLSKAYTDAKEATKGLLKDFFPEIGQDHSTYMLDVDEMTVTIQRPEDCTCIGCQLRRAGIVQGGTP